MAVEGNALCRELELYECIQCGRCTGGCPVSIRSTLNPRRLIYEALLGSRFASADRTEIWECTTCATCAQRCPKNVKPYEVVLALRSDVIEGGRVKPAMRDAMESTFMHGNPWGRSREKRSEWIGDMTCRILKEGEKTDLLYYICCTAAYDPRVQEIPRSMIKVFQAVGGNLAILGDAESCCANEMAEMGENGLFEMAQQNNNETFAKYKFDTMMTSSPHCFHTFSNEYTGMENRVFHYTQVLARMIEEKEPQWSGELNKKITYHDPCFLGKQNGIFDEPRAVIQSIPGVEFIEFDRSRERSLCCEGGGGRMWMESESTEARLAEIRVKDAVEMGVDIVATACPFCLLTLEDAVKTTGNEDKIEIKDIVEIVAGLV